MKKLVFFLFLSGMIGQIHAQTTKDDLPAEFRDVAIQAVQKLGPQTKQWFIDAARQHPPGSFDSTWTFKKLRERFLVSEMELSGGLFAVMMEYHRMMNKEAREDRKLQRQDQKIELVAKEEKLKLDNKSIDEGMKEAREKADNAMSAAQTNLWIGIVNGSAAIMSSNPAVSSAKMNSRIYQPKDTVKRLQVQANQQDLKVKQTQQQAAKTEDEKKANEDHSQRIKDAVKKLLDQMAQMKPGL